MSTYLTPGIHYDEVPIGKNRMTIICTGGGGGGDRGGGGGGARSEHVMDVDPLTQIVINVPGRAPPQNHGDSASVSLPDAGGLVCMAPGGHGGSGDNGGAGALASDCVGNGNKYGGGDGFLRDFNASNWVYSGGGGGGSSWMSGNQRVYGDSATNRYGAYSGGAVGGTASGNNNAASSSPPANGGLGGGGGGTATQDNSGGLPGQGGQGLVFIEFDTI